jgi:UDP-N-acetylglucosamine:LPS N-acetylglucosamine transferase
MQAADLVIGKAGPNMLFETVATETPFFAITHIAGQEDGNLDIIRDYNLGYVEENILKAQRILKQIINHPEQLDKFKTDILKLKKYNQQSKEKLLKIIANLI